MSPKDWHQWKEKKDEKPRFGMQEILDELTSNQPDRLSIDFAGWSHVVPSYIAKSLQSNTVLQHLSLQACQLGDEGVQMLCPVLKRPPIVHLNLGGNGISDSGAVALARALENHATLQELILYWNLIANVGGIALAKCLPTIPNLRVLDLSGILPVGRGGGSGDSFLRTDQIRGDCNFRVAACEELGKALPHTNLVRLCLSRQQHIGSQGVQALARALPHCPSLQQLELQRIPVEDGGAVALAATLNQSSLKLLDLTINRITNVGAVILANSLACNKLLEDVRLTQSAIGENGLRALELAASVNVHLVRLDLYGHEAGPMGTAYVRKIKPWMRLSRRMKCVLDSDDRSVFPELLHYVSRASNPSRLYQVLRTLPDIIPSR